MNIRLFYSSKKFYIVSKELSLTERLQLLIPGYRGYKVKDLVRQDDLLIRNAVKEKIERAINYLGSLESQIAQSNPFSPQLRRMENLMSKLRILLSEINSAQGGGADVGARYKLFAEYLEEIVKNDCDLIELSTNLYEKVVSEDLDGLDKIIQEMRNILFKRVMLFYPKEDR